nr:hypothetical protein BN993_00365 [Virgibacillus halodenitrificans]
MAENEDPWNLNWLTPAEGSGKMLILAINLFFELKILS